MPQSEIMTIELNEDINNQINVVRSVAQEIILEPEENREQKYQELKPAFQYRHIQIARSLGCFSF